MKFRLVEDFDDLLLERVIEPGSELEKSIIHDLENTDTPYHELAKKYGLNSITPIQTILKNRSLNAIPRKRGRRFVVIQPGSELEKSIINDLEHTNKPYQTIADEYGIEIQNIYRLIDNKSLNVAARRLQGYHAYFNTLQVDIRAFNSSGVSSTMKFLPSIYLGYYSSSNIRSMHDHIREKYLKGRMNVASILEFYLNLASNEISLDDLITELRNLKPSPNGYRQEAKYNFITVSRDNLSTVDFYSVDYAQVSKDILTHLNRKLPSFKDLADYYYDLKDAASKLAPETNDAINKINTYIDNNLEHVAYNIYSRKGDVIKATNYINGIPYETSFDISSPQDIAKYIKPYRGYLLYGLMNGNGNIVYIGISVFASGRSHYYDEENRKLILKAFEDKIIKKLIIFKSNLPVNSKSVNIQLTYALESYFAEVLFKTYPENYPNALNKDKPGKNSSRFLSSRNKLDFEIYISNQDRLLNVNEFQSSAKKMLNVVKVSDDFPYYKYAEDYVAKNDGNLSIRDKKILYRNLPSSKMSILWNICSSENEYKEIAEIHSLKGDNRKKFNNWKNYRIKNNLPITEDLDDDIDMEYYV